MLKERKRSDEEVDAAYDVPAVFINRFAVALNDSGVRLSFGENNPKGVSKYRSAIQMSPFHAWELRNALTTILERVEQKTKTIATAPKPRRAGKVN